MSKVVEAVYEKGMLRPLEKLDLPESALARLRIDGIFSPFRGLKIDPQEVKDEPGKLHG